MNENGSKPEELSPEAQAAMDAISALEEAAGVDNSANFSPEFVAEVQQAVADDVISERIAQSVFSCETEEEARVIFEAALAGMKKADEVEAAMQAYRGSVDELMASSQGDLSPEQEEEFNTRLAQLGEKYIAELRALGVSDEVLIEAGLIKKAE